MENGSSPLASDRVNPSIIIKKKKVVL